MTSFPISVDAIPQGSFLGVNYSGMHDTSIAIVAPSGEPVFAVSLERISRVKQDGRSPERLLRDLPWDRIQGVAVSVSGRDALSTVGPSKTHPVRFVDVRPYSAAHGEPFYRLLDSFPCEVLHIPHHLSHAASAFWGGGKEKALCLVYDGGMSNEDCFGGIYDAELGKGIVEVDRFGCAYHANITQLYSAVTAVLGFRAQKHEGKITGLAAYGSANKDCESILSQLLESRELNALFTWRNQYGEPAVPELTCNPATLAHLRRLLGAYSREDVAATLQHMTEAHVVSILERANAIGMTNTSASLCLSGGLFANVKVNQAAAALGYKSVFVSPAMTDDGTALGAAWHIQAMHNSDFKPLIPSMYLGPSAAPEESKSRLDALGVRLLRPKCIETRLAELLADGKVIALFQGQSEFGPRALGNRSIFAQATERSINDTLNKRLSRTEFMPFAPIVRFEDAAACFDIEDNVLEASCFMTVTVPCTQRLRQECPAVVHVDGTARPQLVTTDSNEFAHRILTQYSKITSKLALVNTSFNVHEEPIVCTVEDALRGFFEAGLDFLYVEGAGLIDRRRNREVESRYLRDKVAAQSLKLASLTLELSSGGTGNAVDASMFLSGAAMRPYLVEGFHAPETWGAWSSGRHAKVVLPVERDGRSTVELHITMTLGIFDRLVASAPVVGIRIDGQEVGFALFREHTSRSHQLSFYVQSSSDMCEIAFEVSHSASPFAVDNSDDQRNIGFSLSALGMTASVASGRSSDTEPASSLPTFEGAWGDSN